MIFFSGNLKFLRKVYGLTQGVLAERIGVKANTISNYENGSSSPDLEMLEKIVVALDINADNLLFEDLQTEVEKIETKSIRNVLERNEDIFEDIFEDKRKVQKTSSNMDSDRFDPRDIKLIAALEKTIASHEKVIARDEEVIAGLRQRISDLEKGFGSRGLGSARSPIGEVKPGQRTSL